MLCKMLRLMLIPALPLSICFNTSAQANAIVCPGPTYEDHNQVTPPVLKVNYLKGKAQVDLPGTDSPLGAAAAICIALFTEKEHLLVTSTSTNQNGIFRFPSVAPGRYRLVAYGTGLCTANVRINVKRRKHGKSQRLVVHMRPPGLDSCSYFAFS